MNRTSGIYGTIAKCLKFVSLDTPKERRECGAEKIYEEIMAENFPNLAKKSKRNPTNLQIKKFSKPQIRNTHIIPCQGTAQSNC